MEDLVKIDLTPDDLFTSDTHFGALRTLTLSRRPFESVGQMDRAMIEKIELARQPNSRLISLGDWGDYEAVRRVNCPVILICGNYEYDDIERDFNNDFRLFRTYLLGLGFVEVYRRGILLDDMFANHFPAMRRPERFNLFGHIHKAQMVKRNGLNVGVDCHNYGPVTMEALEFYKNAILNHYDDEVFSL